MCNKGSWGDSKPLDVWLNVGVSCRDSEGVKDRPEKEAGCWYAERAEEEGKELEPGSAPGIKSSAGAGECIATRHNITMKALVNASQISNLQGHTFSLILNFLTRK